MDEITGTLAVSSAAAIAAYSPVPSDPEIEVGQAEHRIRLVNQWRIGAGSRVLEIGCGQGNTTAVLAEAVGDAGSVDAVDPAPPDYGGPFTLAQAQAHLSASAVGRRITWHRAEPADFIRSGTATWDVAVLSHSIWYFASTAVLADILRALRPRVGVLCIAEYALRATEPAAAPHVLAALARGVLESHNPQSNANIRSPLGPSAIAAVARDAGWSLQRETTLVPGPALLDGHWETGSVASQAFVRDIDDVVQDERAKVVLASARDATVAARDMLEGARVRTMDVWVSTFA